MYKYINTYLMKHDSQQELREAFGSRLNAQSEALEDPVNSQAQ